MVCVDAVRSVVLWALSRSPRPTDLVEERRLAAAVERTVRAAELDEPGVLAEQPGERAAELVRKRRRGLAPDRRRRHARTRRRD
jgi:hypothetical protein